MRIRALVLLLLMSPLAPRMWAQTSAAGDVAHESPSAAQNISIGVGRVDAVTGEVTLQVPFGPRLPGRIPLGFTWNGKSVRPVDWPDDARVAPYLSSSSALQRTVVVNGEPWAFLPQAVPGAGSLPTAIELKALLEARGVDLGAAEAGAVDEGGDPIFGFSFMAPSTDGLRLFVQTHWKVSIYNPKTGTMLPRSVAFRTAVIDKSTAIWTAPATAVSCFSNLWGDRVSITESGGRRGAPATLVIRNERVPSHSITLAFTFPQGEPANDFASVAATAAVTNTMGLPALTTIGGATGYGRRQRQAAVAIVPIQYTGTWDMAFHPDGFVETASDGTSRTTQFAWVGGSSPDAALAQVTYPNGLVETLCYTAQVSRLSQYAYSQSTGIWKGYMVEQYPDAVWPAPDIVNRTKPGVNMIIRSGPGVAETTFISRLLPTGRYARAGTTWTQKLHTTSILRFPYAASPGATPTGPYRGVKLIHPSVDAWLALGHMGREAFLFATSTTLGSETFYGSTLDANLQPTGYTVTQATILDGWDLRSWANPTGSLTNGLPVTPVALRTRVFSWSNGVASSPLPTKIRHASGARDAWGPTQTDEYTTTSMAYPGALSGNSIGAWSDAMALPTGMDVHRKGTQSRHLNRALWSLPTDAEQKSLDGIALPSLRYSGAALPTIQEGAGLSSVQFGTTTFSQYDSLGRVVRTEGARDGITATETRLYEPGLPLVSSVKKTLKNGSAPYYPNPANPTVDGITTTYGYDATTPYHWLTSETVSTDGRPTTYARDGLGRETVRTSPLGITIRTQYDPWGNPKQITRDARGLVAAATTLITIDPNGRRKTEIVQADGRSLPTYTDLDALGRVVKVTLPDGSTQSTQYDGWGQKIAQTPVLKPGETPRWNRWEYDSQGRLDRTLDVKGRELSKVTLQPTWKTQVVEGVSLTGLWSTVRDDRGFTRSDMRDLLGQKAAVVDQKGQLSRYWYDQDGRLLKTAQGAQERWYRYNSQGWIVDRFEPEEGRTAFSNHTLLGTPLTATLSGRQGTGSWVTTTTLNDWLLPVQVRATGPEGTVTRILGYRADHLLGSLSETQPGGALTETYGYDDLARLNSKTVSDGTQTFTVSRVLDASGNVTSLTYPSGGGRGAQTATTQYDSLNRPWILRMDNAIRGQMAYGTASGSGWTDTLMYGNGATTASSMDQGELVSVIHQVMSGLPGNQQVNRMTWSAGGLLLSRGPGATAGDAANDRFDYDDLQRLTYAKTWGINGELAQQWFRYDRWGNRTLSDYTYAANGGMAKPDELMAWSAAYDGGNRLPAQVSGLAPGSTSGGTTGGSVSGSLITGVTYDDLGRMTSVNAIPGTTASRTASVYDPSGRITSETVNGVASTFLLDSEGLRFKRMKADGSVEHTVYGFGREPLMTFRKPSGGAMAWKKTLVYGFGTLISEERPEGTVYVQGDQVGSPNILTNASGAVVGRAKNLPFGERFGSTGEKSARRYTNHEDQDGSAIYMQARTYLPTYGKFAQVDPIYDQSKGDPESWNLYNYVTNNPVTHTDPDGRGEKGAYQGAMGNPNADTPPEQAGPEEPDDEKEATEPATPPATLPGATGQTKEGQTPAAKEGEAQSGTGSLQLNTSGDLSKYSSNLGGSLSTSGPDLSSVSGHLNDPVTYKWVEFSQSKGSITLNDFHIFSNKVDGALLNSTSYAGIDTNRFLHNPNLIQGKNNPSAQGEQFIGPLPQGKYGIGAPGYNAHTGDYSLRLTPSPANNMLGRNSFLWHGDSKSFPGQASEGCVVSPYSTREKAWSSGYRDMWVVP